ncbi:unnamed protein product [Absidia cylindrospora]
MKLIDQIYFTIHIEINAYILSIETPSFKGFVAKHNDDIPLWSVKLPSITGDSLHGVWFNRYCDVFMAIKDSKKRPRKTRYNEIIWNAIANSTKDIIQLKSVYTDMPSAH